MKKITIITSTAVPLPIENIDTDQITPARFLKGITKEGFGEILFNDWRYDHVGNEKKDFILNNPKYTGKILVAGKNFGCGSSREHAAWSLKDYGFQVVVSSFFADIFKSNALNNFLLPVTVSELFLQDLFYAIEEKSDVRIEIDLPNQLIRVPSHKMMEEFEISTYKKMCLMEGFDDVGYLLSLQRKLKQFEAKRTNDYSLTGRV
ncbi:3-isopropylmalate dehydratase small subunit [Candidatus Roizmanbacteria bacterium CG11_big_fil_rev_8_21_14_0_20_36_8]|uniref:3-isopropylmalate dehydratase small subunit n=2 Tax=Candidatus Roizmaniibacteriota TaxID=1752723 RepID=A0A2M6IV40_9BACT|nr:MAG: 3-isopropylmalate dehydratase small subunit [Candidatus Roizmanbacteria bacterium CG11_big_fil_rev_8_21_14_0_20_36_8]PIZ62827.1 MAG: 3-isopropylmalate dehydratase small subunit [Candidatus Roizmanbacteria bacterium CG_4_10_14_0_2_um_filter_39_13]